MVSDVKKVGLQRLAVLQSVKYAASVEAPDLLNFNPPRCHLQSSPTGTLIEENRPPRLSHKPPQSCGVGPKRQALVDLCRQWGPPRPQCGGFQDDSALFQRGSPVLEQLNVHAPPGLAPPEQVQRQGRGEAQEATSFRLSLKKRDLLSQYENHDGPIVTLMLRNIPCRITQQQLVEVVESMGFAERYDFLYLPTAGRSSTAGSSNLGYGFINFIDHRDVDPFTHAFTNYKFEATSSMKACTVRPAHIQGLENNILHFDGTVTKGRFRERGPIIRRPKQLPEQSFDVESSIETLHEEAKRPTTSMEPLNWLKPSYFDFLDDLRCPRWVCLDDFSGTALPSLPCVMRYTSSCLMTDQA